MGLWQLKTWHPLLNVFLDPRRHRFWQPPKRTPSYELSLSKLWLHEHWTWRKKDTCKNSLLKRHLAGAKKHQSHVLIQETVLTIWQWMANDILQLIFLRKRFFAAFVLFKQNWTFLGLNNSQKKCITKRYYSYAEKNKRKRLLTTATWKPRFFMDFRLFQKAFVSLSLFALAIWHFMRQS